MKLASLIVLLSLSLGVVFAQENQTSVVDKKFVFVGMTLLAATTLDGETTFYCINAERCKEGSPIMRPFVSSGRPATYGLLLGLDAGAMVWAYRQKKNHKKLWWLLPVAMTAGHAIAGGANLRFTFK